MRVIVISPGVIETEVLHHVKDITTLAKYGANKAAIGGGIRAEHVANLILDACNLPQNALGQEISASHRCARNTILTSRISDFGIPLD